MNELNNSVFVSEIYDLHNYLQQRSFQQVNISITIRNWIIGFYIVEYEQNGSDRASYGSGVLKEMEGLLRKTGIKGLDERSLRSCRLFYQLYPQIWGTVSAKLLVFDNQFSKRVSIKD